ncbi:MAG: hypothetical protein AAFQ40_17765 [Cyanobacteria bacterium J06623_5]
MNIPVTARRDRCSAANEPTAKYIHPDAGMAAPWPQIIPRTAASDSDAIMAARPPMNPGT